MKRYWVPKELVQESRIDLSGDVFHHIHRVCRNDVGSKFEILVGDQIAYFVELKEAGKKSGWAEILEKREIPPLKKPYVHLALSIPRFQKMDWVMEKAVELGAAAFHPFVSDNSFVRTVDAKLQQRSSRWEKIVMGATQQSGRGDLMPVSSPRTLDQLLDDFNQRSNIAGLFPYEGEADKTVFDALRNYSRENEERNIQEFWIFVGSEGGFSLQEVEKFREVGLQPVTMGEQILRVDTACVALLSIIKYELGLMEG